MDETKRSETATDPTGKCECKPWPLDPPVGTEPFRRLLAYLEKRLEEFANEPTEATKKFADDLKDADKEYQGQTAIVDKYREFYEKLDCELAKQKNWCEEMAGWFKEKPTADEKNAIRIFRNENYDKEEKKICCDWIGLRAKYIDMLDCLEHAKKSEEDAKDDYEAIKGFEKTLTQRFADLKSIYDEAKALPFQQRYKAVFAEALEFFDVYSNLSVLSTWDYAVKKCGEGDPAQAPDNLCPDPDLKTRWTVENFRSELVGRLRELILKKYQKFRWQQAFLTTTSNLTKKKDACKDFRDTRRKEFIQEADEINPKPKESEGGGTTRGSYDKAQAQ